jgi:hypothetical protein
MRQKTISATPTTWTSHEDRGRFDVLDANGYSILTVEYAGNYSGTAAPGFQDEDIAALVARAVNCHEELVAALNACMQVLAVQYQTRMRNGGAGQQAYDKARAALARAKGEPA